MPLTEAAAAFWRAYLAGLPADHPHHTAHVTAFSFGDSPALADELAALVVAGRKRATASLPVQFEVDGGPLPAAGDVWIVTRADTTPVAIIETTDVRLVPFGAVDSAFAEAEGEDDGSLASWQAAHTAFFRPRRSATRRATRRRLTRRLRALSRPLGFASSIELWHTDQAAREPTESRGHR